MNPIKITDKDGTVIAEHTTDHPRSSYGTPVWTICDDDPAPGPAILFTENISCPVEIIGLKHGWLVCRRSDGFLFGVIWSDGSYHADTLVDADEQPVKEYRDGLHVRGTVPIGGLGSVLL